MTRGVESSIPMPEILEALRRHVSGDWGNVCDEDAAQNEWSLANDARVLSSYEAENGTVFWIITEANRAATTVLLPEEY